MIFIVLCIDACRPSMLMKQPYSNIPKSHHINLKFTSLKINVMVDWSAYTKNSDRLGQALFTLKTYAFEISIKTISKVIQNSKQVMTPQSVFSETGLQSVNSKGAKPIHTTELNITP